MTDKEAKMKWCPMARAAACETDGNSVNRHIPASPGVLLTDGFYNPEFARCLGSTCACWVWDAPAKLETDTVLSFGPADQEPEFPTADFFPVPPGSGWKQDGEPDMDDNGYFLRFTRDHDPERQGHCGLAR